MQGPSHCSDYRRRRCTQHNGIAKSRHHYSVPDNMMTSPNNNNNDNNRSNNYTVAIASSEKIIFGDPEYEKLTKAFPKPQAAEIQRIPSMPRVPSYGGAGGGISFEQQQQKGNAAFPTSSSSTNDNTCSCWSTYSRNRARAAARLGRPTRRQCRPMLIIFGARSPSWYSMSNPSLR